MAILNIDGNSNLPKRPCGGRSPTKTRLIRHGDAGRTLLHSILFLVAMLSIAANSANAMAAELAPPDFRVSMAVDRFKETWEYAAVYRLRPPRRLRTSHLEFALGAITSKSQTHAFVSFGPAWRLPLVKGNDRWHVQLGLSPTLLSGSRLGQKNLGGNLYFTSSVSVSALIGKRRALSIAVRVQHTSNGGLNNSNPGLDMIGLDIRYEFGRRRPDLPFGRL